jgi:glycosyltransferase involved in cell wall biosynthesis
MEFIAKKILLIIPYGGVGGMERLALNLYHHYRQLGFEVKVVKLVRLPTDIVNFGPDEIVLSEHDLAQMPFSRRCIFYLGIPLSIARIVRRFRITHSIAFGDMANLFSSLSPSREFKVASIHALKSIELSVNNMLNHVFRIAYKTSYRRFARVVCISHAIRHDLLEHCGFGFPRLLDVIYNPHDVDNIIKMSLEKLPSDEESIFQGRTIAFLGRLSVQKSPWHLVNAFNEVLSKGLSARLLMIGDGDPEVISYLHKQIAAFGIVDQVVFLGRRDNPYKYLARSDVLALSSHYEGTPNVIVEAIALGIPVVSSCCTEGIGELMSLNPKAVSTAPAELDAGILTPNLYGGSLGVPPKGASTKAEADFADALVEVLTNSSHRERLIAARAELLAKFDLTKSAESYLQPLVATMRESA